MLGHSMTELVDPLSVATDFSEDNQASPDYLDKTVRKMGLQRMSGYSGLYC